MTFALRGQNGQKSVAASVDDDVDDGFLVELTATETSALKPGLYSASFIFRETDSGEIASESAGVVTVTANLTDTTTGPRRAAYEAARAALDAMPGRKFVSFNLRGESVTYQSVAELQALVDRLHIDALAEDRERGLPAAGGAVRIITRM